MWKLLGAILLVCVVYGKVPDDQKRWIGEKIEALIAEVDPTASYGIKVISAKEGEVVYERNSSKRFIPASSLKLFTAGAALAVLGGEDRFRTDFVTNGKVVNGSLKGDCFLVASGDPTLSFVDLFGLVEGIGMLKEIVGDLVIDLGQFSSERKGPGWMWDDAQARWAVPVCTLNLEHNWVNDSVIQEPERLAALFILKAFERKGIRFTGKVRFGESPDGARVLATHYSAPVVELLNTLLKESDNLYADCLFKKMGGSWEHGQLTLQCFLKEGIGIDPNELIVVDGSGLSRYNLISPDQMIVFLKAMKRAAPFRSALAVGGKDGTLERRMQGFQGRVEAKSGSMSGVTSLCGYLTSESGEEFIFAVFINGTVKKVRELKLKFEDELCHLLVSCF